MKDIITVANESNAQTIKALQDLQPIHYDGLHCPQCDARTVASSGWVWCPNIGCDFGNELKMPDLITKWFVRMGNE